MNAVATRQPPEIRGVQERKFADLMRCVLESNLFYQRKYETLGFATGRPPAPMPAPTAACDRWRSARWSSLAASAPSDRLLRPGSVNRRAGPGSQLSEGFACAPARHRAERPVRGRALLLPYTDRC